VTTPRIGHVYRTATMYARGDASLFSILQFVIGHRGPFAFATVTDPTKHLAPFDGPFALCADGRCGRASLSPGC